MLQKVGHRDTGLNGHCKYSLALAEGTWLLCDERFFFHLTSSVVFNSVHGPTFQRELAVILSVGQIPTTAFRQAWPSSVGPTGWDYKSRTVCYRESTDLWSLSLLNYRRNGFQKKRQSTKTTNCIHVFKPTVLLTGMSQLSTVTAELEQSNFCLFWTQFLQWRDFRQLWIVVSQQWDTSRYFSIKMNSNTPSMFVELLYNS